MDVNEAQRATFCDLTLACLRPRTAPTALGRIETWLKSGEAGGDLVGCLFSELGVVNQILLLRRFDDVGTLLEARRRVVHSADPLGICDFALDLVMNIAVELPGRPEAAAASAGSAFEVRTDVPRPGSLDRAVDLWLTASTGAEPRARFGAYTIAGDRQSIVHVWSWTSIDERSRLADDASPTNIWRLTGPDSAPLAQHAEIFRAATFSPMQ